MPRAGRSNWHRWAPGFIWLTEQDGIAAVGLVGFGLLVPWGRVLLAGDTS